MIIQTRNLTKKVTSGNGELTILEDINLELEEGRSLAIVGPSGSGKSTLLGLLAGLDSPTEGEIFLNNQPLHKLSEEERALARKKNVAFVFQSFELLPGLSALENVMLPSELNLDSQAKERATEYLSRVGLENRTHHYPRQLSGGEQQRICIARAIVNNPPILLADEPTGSLDQKTGTKISDLLFEVNEESSNALVVVTHDSNLASRCDKQISLSEGLIT